MDHLNSSLYTDAPAETQGLSWGRSYLMCPPDYFGVFYEINPWMHTENAVDQDRTQEQWHHLVANLRRAGATVQTLEPVKSLPDIVFKEAIVTIISLPQTFNEEELYVDLRSIFGHPLFLKCEGFNFAGSIKLKAANEMVE